MNNKFSKKELFFLSIPLFTFLFYIRSKSLTLNYPIWLHYVTFSVTMIIVCIVWKKELFDFLRKIRRKVMFTFSLILELIGLGVFSYMLSGVLLIPFNYYNIHISEKNSAYYIDCQLKNVVVSRKSSRIDFFFNGETCSINADSPIMKEIHDKKNFEDYIFVVKVRDGLMGTIVIENWSIEQK